LESSKQVLFGVDLDEFIEGKIDMHEPGVLTDHANEWRVWRGALRVLKSRGLTKDQALEKFSKIPGFNECVSEYQINKYWDMI
jgi:hypothetical protein